MGRIFVALTVFCMALFVLAVGRPQMAQKLLPPVKPRHLKLVHSSTRTIH
jgi:hypothetical protein